MRKKHKGLILKRARQLSSIQNEVVHLAGFGWGYLRQRGDDPDDIYTWFEVEHRSATLNCGIHPAQVKHIRNLRRPTLLPTITLRHIRAIEQLVDVESGEVFCYAGEIMDNDIASRWLGILDDYVSRTGIPNCMQWKVSWDWTE